MEKAAESSPVPRDNGVKDAQEAHADEDGAGQEQSATPKSPGGTAKKSDDGEAGGDESMDEEGSGDEVGDQIP